MTPEQFKQLRRGDIVRNKRSGETMVVDAIHSDFVVLVQTITITGDFANWDLAIASSQQVVEPTIGGAVIQEG